jgi:hypothetical protein
MGRVKLITPTPAGGVSERVRLSVALPLTVQFVVQTAVFRPLQEVRAKIAEIPRIRRPRFEFMQTPHVKIKHQAGRAVWSGFPQEHSTACG